MDPDARGIPSDGGSAAWFVGAVVTLFAVVGLVAAARAAGSSYLAGGARDVVSGPAGLLRSKVLVKEARFPVALTALPGGGFLSAEHETGNGRREASDGTLDPAPAATVAVRLGGQRGLLGVAVDKGARVFADWIRASDGREVIGQVAPGSERVIWEGPESAELANGGHIAFDPDGRLVVGIGDVLDRSKFDDPAAPNGRFLALDPDGPSSQKPAVLSCCWNNPYAFAFSPSGKLWVADNAPELGERLARADIGLAPSSVLTLPGVSAPSGLAIVGESALVVCGYVSRSLVAYEIGREGVPAAAGKGSGSSLPIEHAGILLTRGCATGATTLSDGRIVYSDENSIWIVDRILPG